MKLLKYFIPVTSILMVSTYLTALINAEDLLSPLKAWFIFAYFIVTSVVVWMLCSKFLSKRVKKNKSLILVALILSTSFVYFVPQFAVPKSFKATTITLFPNGNKNKASLGTEIRINKVIVNNTFFDLSQINLPSGWERTKDNVLLCYPNSETQQLNLSLPKANKLEISFLSHRWSGILEIQDGDIRQEIDLYSDASHDLIYTVNSNKQQPHIIVVISSIVFWGGVMFLFSSILVNSKK